MKSPMMLLAFPAAVMVIGVVTSSLDPNRAERQDWQRFSANAEVNAQIQETRLHAESQLAETRYSSGACVLSELALEPGMTVSNLSPGSAVCDNHGTTAIVAKGGSLDGFARTNNTTVIRSFLGW